MHKVDSFGATVANEFTNGNPQLQIPRTRLEAKFMNTLQRELCALVELGATSLSDADDQQLAQSVVLLATSVVNLQAFPVAGNPRPFVAFLQSQNGGSDARAGFYVWSNASVAAPSGLTVIQPASAPASGRWLVLQLYLESVSGAAPLASPAFTGTPTAPTATAGTNTTQLATTAFVRAAITALVNSSPTALDTLNELAAALGNDANFAATMVAALAGKSSVGHTHGDSELTSIAWSKITGVPAIVALNESGSFTGTLTGMSATLQGTINWSRVGNLVTLFTTAEISGSSIDTSMQLTGVPAALTPATNKEVMCSRLRDSAQVAILGAVLVRNTGSFLFLRMSEASGYVFTAPFTASGTKGLLAQWSITYDLS